MDSEGEPRTVRLRVDLSYDGSAFSGWAAQPGRRTVEDVRGRGARTGAAAAGAAHADRGRPHRRGGARPRPGRPPGRPRRRPGPARRTGRRRPGWPGCCPPTSGCAPRARRPTGSTRGSPRCGGVTPTASATTEAAADPLRRHETLWYFRRLDLAAMNEAAAAAAWASTTSPPSAASGRARPPSGRCAPWTGTGTTTASRSRPWWPTRSATTWSARWSARCSRSARGGGRPAGPRAVLAAAVRDPAVRVVPPHGLCLEEVGYPPAAELAARAAHHPHRSAPVAERGRSGLAGQHPGAEVDVGAAGDEVRGELLQGLPLRRARR